METSNKQFEQIVHANKSTIYSVCYMFARDAAEADDLFQETLLNLWRGLPAFRQQSNLRTWVYRVSLNTCISHDRRRARRGEHMPLDININLFSDDGDGDGDGGGDAATAQARMLRSRIQRLDLFDRAIVLLWLEDLSYEEIGAIVGISAKRVSVRLVRIREKLKKMSND